MHELSEFEIRKALLYAKSITKQDDIQGIIDHFHREQTALTDTIFGIFPDVIAEHDPDMAHLFVELCFTSICIFQHAFGPPPLQTCIDPDWLENQIMLLNAELLSIGKQSVMDERIKHKLQDRFVSRALEDTQQLELLSYLNAVIDDYASEQLAIEETARAAKTMLYIVIRLLCNLYSKAAE